MSISDDKLCSFCGEYEETITHLFYECKLVNLLWQTLYNWIAHKSNIRIIPNITSAILGYTDPYPYPAVINTINMITKSYIFYCSRNKLRLNIFQLQTCLKSAYETYEFNAIKKKRLCKFQSKMKSVHITIFKLML